MNANASSWNPNAGAASFTPSWSGGAPAPAPAEEDVADAWDDGDDDAAEESKSAQGARLEQLGAPELRIDSSDGNAYPLQSFYEAYGMDEGQYRWDRSEPLQQPPRTGTPAEPKPKLTMASLTPREPTGAAAAAKPTPPPAAAPAPAPKAKAKGPQDVPITAGGASRPAPGKAATAVAPAPAPAVAVSSQALVTMPQVQALEARLDALEEAGLLGAEEAELAEDILADFVVFRQSIAPLPITAEVIRASPAACALHTMLGLAEAFAVDRKFARQLRRQVLR